MKKKIQKKNISSFKIKTKKKKHKYPVYKKKKNIIINYLIIFSYKLHYFKRHRELKKGRRAAALK